MFFRTCTENATVHGGILGSQRTPSGTPDCPPSTGPQMSATGLAIRPLVSIRGVGGGDERKRSRSLDRQRTTRCQDPRTVANVRRAPGLAIVELGIGQNVFQGARTVDTADALPVALTGVSTLDDGIQITV